MAEGRRKTMTGRVVSDKMDKTVVVTVQSTTRHRLYNKILRRSKRYLAHDEGDAKPGDTVLIEETRPYSRNKRWRVAEVIRRGEVADIAPREIDSEYLSMQRQVETPAPPPPRKEDDAPDAVEAPEAESSTDTASEDAETAVEQPEASAAAEEAAADEPASDDSAEEASADEEPAADEPAEDASAGEETAGEETSTDEAPAAEAPASDEEQPAENEDDKA